MCAVLYAYVRAASRTMGRVPRAASMDAETFTGLASFRERRYDNMESNINKDTSEKRDH